jgi:uncharacterized protein
MEHLQLTETPDAVVAVGVVLGVADGKPFDLTYQVRVDQSWRVQACELHVAGASSHELLLIADGMGHWLDATGAELPALEGCLDIDIAVTPFTNTLPVRRLALEPGQSEEITVAYISVPDLSVRAVRQRYTLQARTDAGSTYRYEGLESDFKADVTVNADGLVVDYPPIWRRVR